MDSRKEDSINILKSWHLVEFFQAYSVPDKDDSKIAPVNVSCHELKSCGNHLLPWLDPAARDSLGLTPGKKCTYTLYLGLFDKSAIDKKVAEYFSTHSQEDCVSEEIEQRRDNEGASCFAKLMLDDFGSPRLDTFSVSTLPWALAELLGGRAGSISQERFDSRCDALNEFIDRWEATLPNHPSSEGRHTLCVRSLMSLVEGLYQWAGISNQELLLSEHSTVYPFQMAFFEYEAKSDNLLEDKSKSEEAEDDNEDDPSDNESQLPILNSFYIRDIERAISAISTGRASKPLQTYLGQSSHKHIDLYTNDSIPLIHKHLNPKETPEGRWLTEPAHNMSLMQQFAINTVFKELKTGGVISVNGPPGTGKTTLLRDIIAQNIVERAKVLASFSKASDGLNPEGFLVQELTDFEMVVASSNNAAVENISKELPQAKSIADRYANTSFFRSVANQISADEKKGRLQPLNDKMQSWGNISAAMGAYKKRQRFLDRFFFKYHYEKHKEPAVREPSLDFLNFWQYRSTYTGPSFNTAKKAFNEKLSRFHELNDKLAYFDSLQNAFDEHQFDVYLHRMNLALNELENYAHSLSVELDALNSTRNAEVKREEEVSISLELLKVNSPGWFSRFFNTKKNKQYKASLSQKLSEFKSVKKAIRLIVGDVEAKKIEIKGCAKKISQQRADIASKDLEKRTLLDELGAYRTEFKEYHLPEITDDIEDHDRQRHACWQHATINELRSDIYAAALELHEAWLIEVSKHSAFLSKIRKINDVVLGKSSENALAIWQILFMFVPVVSTTFASLGNMFSKLPPESLGWLMIDEAGQAIPQAAVGGLLRAKRAVVVGDPLQIEPVFTSPPELIDYLMQSKLQEESEKWDPCKWSVQTLADRVNPYGCMIDMDGENQWIGIPLWVHRRCIEPMFSISNEIAYNNRMIHGSDNNKDVEPRTHKALGYNRWNDSQGDCVLKQYKRELGEDVKALLLELAAHNGDLNSIYLITPFKAVKKELKEDLRRSKSELLSNSNWKGKDFNNFLKHNVGTVHTFQGKENDTVILVLGCDTRNSGGASWASSKPNLLNVAVTRAKKHLYVIGDIQVWSDKRYFDKTYSKLNHFSLKDYSQSDSTTKHKDPLPV
ncbi:AAA domain-containing protein [Vibrio paracholerae]|uniref:DEAD/DEAH box helicase n=1 Tax=Vibrio paracholerae TaxID=650003 RepID=UPI0020950F81|nr:AAA domain-containing protein [Vibrio paracholerae]